MRVMSCVFIALSVLGVAAAQETNFATGPQYLMTSGSSLFARPISTPSMSLEGPPPQVGATNATGVLFAGATDQTVLPPSAVALPFVNFFSIFYGTPPVSVIEISFPKTSAGEIVNPGLPASILDTGVWRVTTAEALRLRGYGVTLGEAAASSKQHVRHADRVYTNSDIDPLHRSN
jgi:hypothetical protein